MEYTLKEVQAMSLSEVKLNLKRVMIADRDSNNYVEAYIFYDQEDELSLGVVYAREKYYDFDISVVAGYEFDIRECPQFCKEDYEKMSIEDIKQNFELMYIAPHGSEKYEKVYAYCDAEFPTDLHVIRINEQDGSVQASIVSAYDYDIKDAVA